MEEKPRVLVVYGYHPDELFAIDLGIDLESLRLQNVLVKRYDGKPDPLNTSEMLNIRKKCGEMAYVNRCLRNPQLIKECASEFRCFIDKYSPVDYVIDLHDNGPRIQEMEELVKKNSSIRYPSLHMIHEYNRPFYFKEQVKAYCYSKSYNVLVGFSKVMSPKSIFSGASSPQTLFLENCDLIGIEFYRNLISKQEAFDFLFGLIKIYQSSNH